MTQVHTSDNKKMNAEKTDGIKRVQVLRISCHFFHDCMLPTAATKGDSTNSGTFPGGASQRLVTCSLVTLYSVTLLLVVAGLEASSESVTVDVNDVSTFSEADFEAVAVFGVSVSLRVFFSAMTFLVVIAVVSVAGLLPAVSALEVFSEGCLGAAFEVSVFTIFAAV